MLLRLEAPEDGDAIAAVHAAAFGAGAAGAGPGADGALPAATVAEARLVAALRSEGDVIHGLSVVALADGRLVGHVVCSRGAVDGQPLAGLGPLGVLPAHQGRGVGHALLHGVLAAADALGEPGMAVLGSPSYYGRFGFVPARSLGLEAPDPAWGTHFQVRRLSAWSPALRGAYRYARAFDDL